jgi:hypothetical protein
MSSSGVSGKKGVKERRKMRTRQRRERGYLLNEK